VGLRRDTETLAARMLAHMLHERAISAHASSLVQLTSTDTTHTVSPLATQAASPQDLLCVIVLADTPAPMLRALLKRVQRVRPQAVIHLCKLSRDGTDIPSEWLDGMHGDVTLSRNLAEACQWMEECLHPTSAPQKPETSEDRLALLKPALT
jgi:hypothetical protein